MRNVRKYQICLSGYRNAHKQGGHFKGFLDILGKGILFVLVNLKEEPEQLCAKILCPFKNFLDFAAVLLSIVICWCYL